MKAIFMRIVVPVTIILSVLALMSGCSDAYGHRVVAKSDHELTVRGQDGTVSTHAVAADARITLDGQSADLQQLDVGDKVALTTEDRAGLDVATAIDAQTAEPAAPESVTPENVMPESVVPDNPASPVYAPPLTVPQDIRPGNSGSSEPDRPDRPAPSEPRAEDQPAPEEFSGTISSLTTVDNKFAVKIDRGEEQTFTVNDQTKFTLDGKEATFGDLSVDQKVTVTAEREGDTFLAKSVQAMSS
jgi:hypothetical protein